jgi:hypothetical protein
MKLGQVFGGLISPDEVFSHSLAAHVPTHLRPFLFEWLALSRLNELHRVADTGSTSKSYIENLLRHLSLRVKVFNSEAIPQSGGLVVVSNHPTGIADGFVLTFVLLSIRNDVRVLGNRLLNSIERLRDLLIPVDPFGEAGSALFNSTGMRRSLRWVRGGGVLVAFPAGEVAHFRSSSFRVLESGWEPRFARFLQIARVPVIPTGIEGRPNSWLFHVAGLAHPLLRTLQLPREFSKKEDSEMSIRFGTTVACRQDIDPERLASQLRNCSLRLIQRDRFLSRSCW